MSKYLLIDDDSIIQFVHRNVIAQFDSAAEVESVMSAAEGIAALEDGLEVGVPDVIMLDINMPILSGFDFLDELIANHPAVYDALREKSCLYLLTSSVNPRDVERAKAYEIIASLLPKPLNSQTLKSLGFGCRA
jgi:CheY-like chemotaxis protein